MPAPIWHDFCPHDADQIERAHVANAPTADILDAAFLSSQDGAGRLLVRLRPDEARRRWAEHPETGQRWAVRRVHKVLAPQHGAISPARERAIDESRRITAAVQQQVLQEAEVEGAARAACIKEERDRRSADRRHLRAMREESAEAHRSEAARNRKRLDRVRRTFAREDARAFDDLRDDIQRERTERRQRRETQREQQERDTEKRHAKHREEAARLREQRDDLNRAAFDSVAAAARRGRAERERQDAWLREGAGPCPPKVALTRGQWRVRQERLEAFLSVKRAQGERRQRLEDDRREESSAKQERRLEILHNRQRCRELGIASGGGGFGARSGGLVVVSSPQRRSPDRASGDEDDDD